MPSHLFLGSADSVEVLTAELARSFPAAESRLHPPSLVELQGPLVDATPWPPIVFARQVIPHAVVLNASSIRLWAEQIAVRCREHLPEGQPWRLHVFPHYGGSEAGRHRCALIEDATRGILRQKHRRTLRSLEPHTDPFSPAHSLVQLVLTSSESGFFSIAPAPMPWKQRHLLLPLTEGNFPVAVDKSAPSRAFAKLAEAELRIGRPIPSGATCVDLGACPGSWSYTALRRGASVHAVDRSPLREDLMTHPRLTFHRGDAFRFQPEDPVDWLLCDVIAAPQRSIDLLLRWIHQRWCHAFVVTFKFKGTADYVLLDALKKELPAHCDSFVLTRLCANRNEACAAGFLHRPTRPENLRLPDPAPAGSIPPRICPDGSSLSS